MSAQLLSTTQGRTMILTLSNPAQRNALGPGMYAAGIEALNAAEANPDIRSLIFTGEGRMFCAGGDLNRLLANRQQAPEVQTQSITQLHDWIEAIRNFPKPVIAAVEGAAAGAGFSLVLACDLVVAARDAQFVMAYSNVGLSPDGGASWALAQALPRAMVSEMLMMGGRTDAARLHAMGMINRLVEPGSVLEEALALAERLNERAPNVMSSVKELISEAGLSSLHSHLDREREHFVRNLHHVNGGIGIEAFLGKRSPRYE